MVTREELIEGWLAWAAKHGASEAAFMSGIGLVYEHGGVERYASEGYPVLLRDAENETHGTVTYQQGIVQKF